MEKPVKHKIIVSSYDDLKNPCYGGGGAISIHEAFKRLTDDFEVTVITGKYPYSQDEVVEKIFYKRVGTNFLGPKIGQLIFQLLLPVYALTQDFDLWVESFTPPFSTACLQLFTSKPVVGLVHMLSGEDMRRKYQLPFHWPERLGLTTYKYFIVMSELTRSIISNFNRSSSFLLAPGGVSPSAKSADYQTRDKKCIAFIGRIEVDQKGLDLLIQAFNMVKNKIGFKLKIAGDGQQKEVRKLNNLIDYHHLRNQVELLGRVSGKAKENLYQQAFFVVVPSRFETFSLSALEAFSFGIPLIAFDIDGLRWIPEGCLFKVPNLDARQLSQAMVKLYYDVSLRNSLSQKSRQFIKKYSWESTSQKYKNYFEKILQA